ncbi:DNA polymerase subunit beta [Methanosphaera cuniculi]|uniref:Polymerase nucleotidyl transferase domain-containing protein n=1 Tax=Methanosphaera cuniculi TaxID=1077256 RepID=A0A2A2HFI7_9EURY|nr:DNA polymerase subunit beta [Methanosphaera cuniculi]PAV08231.1 hypothetical protein ASJ82_03295 [Methanosphaera cuniculi]PWL08318.1 hypothetical protein MSCUN_07540 [Methanosphaera cuniculi]
MNIRPRYFIQTKDDLFFAVNTYTHPEDYIIAFLRYVPDENGDRSHENLKYSKVDSDEAYEYIKKHHPNYLFKWNVENKKMMGVPTTDIKKILSPIKRLDEILNMKSDDPYIGKIQKLAEIFHNECDISYENMGITGSTLPGLQKSETSDIDFIIFGLDNHKKARLLYKKLKEDPESILNPIEGEFWERVYNKRIKDDSLDFDEFIFYEKRKNNRGLIDNTLFDILSTMNPDDPINTDELYYKQIGKMKIKCKIQEDKQSFDTPSIYDISDVEIIEGPNVKIDKLVSYTHTYAGEVQNNEWVIASGVCEEVTNKTNNTKTYNLTIGTTRESIGEYIKLKEKPV